MRRLSIFSFDTYRAHWRIGRWALYLLILLLATELVLRVPAVTAHLPPPEPTLWHATLIQNKLDYLRSFEASHGIDVLFIGNSTVQAGIDPAQFDAMVKRQQAEDSFNAAIEGLPPYGMLMFLQIYLRYAHPKTIIYGVTPQDLNSNSPWARDVTDRVKHSPMALAEARWGLQGKLTHILLDHSALFRYRFLLHQLLLRGGLPPPPPEVYFDPRGFDALEASLADVPPEARGIYYNRAGVLNYSVKGEQLEAFRQLLTLVREHGIELILVNMPLADDYYGNFDSPADYPLYLTTIQALAKEFAVPFWDMETTVEANAIADADFADFNHLNQHGADKLTHMLAVDYLHLIGRNAQVQATR